ncbi:unnamed protein product [Aphanomyces euteiches]
METLLVQRQIRENASYLQDYLGDLNVWESSMTKREAQRAAASKRSAAPVRKAVAVTVRGSQDSVSIPHPINAVKTSTKAPSQHVYDKGYQKWDSFDVEAALKKVDEPARPRPTAQESIPQPERPVKKVVAASRTTKTAPATPSVPRDVLDKEEGNRHFKAGDFAAAISCYSRSLSYNPRNPVVLSNRAMAHLKMNQFEKAEIDCTAALTADSGHVKSLVRCATARNSLGKHHAALLDLEAAMALDPTSKAIATQIKQTRENIKQSVRRAPTTRVQVVVEAPPTPEPAKPAPQEEAPRRPAAKTIPKIQVRLPDKAPSTAYEFVRVWKSLKHSSEMLSLRRAYLGRLRVDSLATLFKDSIEADLVSELIETLRDEQDVVFALDFLHGLTRVPRFSMVSMFFTADEKTAIKELLAKAPPAYTHLDAIQAAFDVN